MAEWQQSLKTSTGLAFVGGFKFERIDALLAKDDAAQRLQSALARKPSGSTGVITAERLAQVRVAIASAINGACLATNRTGTDCSAPTEDNPVPPPRAVRVANALTGEPLPLTSWGGKPFEAYNHAKMAELFGQKTMTYDLRPSLIRTWWADLGKAFVLTGLQIHYVDATGDMKVSEKFGEGSQHQCDITIAGRTRVRNLEIFAGTHIDAIRVYDGTDSKHCGNIENGKSHPVNLNKNEYFVGFAGSHGTLIDSLMPLKAQVA
jgi:hypothetical protein